MSVFGGRLNLLRERILFLRVVGALLESGETAPDALAECLIVAKLPTVRSEIRSIQDAVRSGGSFSEASRSAKTLIPPILRAVIQSGEQSGRMHEALTQAAGRYEESYQSQQEFRSVLIYPAIIFIVASIAVIFLASAVIPNLTGIYAANDQNIPLVTQAVVLLSRLLIGALIGFAVGAILYFSHAKAAAAISKFLDRFLHFIPGLKDSRVAFETSEWTRNLSILLEAGVLLPDALDLLALESPSPDSSDIFLRIRNRIHAGQSPYQAFSEESGIPELAVRMIRAGDRSGKIAAAFRHIHDFFRSDCLTRNKRLILLAEPAAILLAGLFVLLIALGVMLPMADLGSLAQ